jgi:hypothetical protein
MTGPGAPLRRGSQFAYGVLDQIGTIAGNAAREDQQGTWGIDSWVRLVHNLIDLQIRSSAAAVQAAVGGPWWVQPTDVDPNSADDVELPDWAKTYPVTIGALGPFTRIGRPSETLDAKHISFEPELLAPGVNRFKIGLKDNRVLGANYRGEVGLFLRGTEPEVTYPVVVGL